MLLRLLLDLRLRIRLLLLLLLSFLSCCSAILLCIDAVVCITTYNIMVTPTPH